jgi:hypothetical protein
MAQTLTAASGLVSQEGAHVPLVGVVARAEIRDYACRVVLSQRFRNDEDRPIEAVYTLRSATTPRFAPEPRLSILLDIYSKCNVD